VLGLVVVLELVMPPPVVLLVELLDVVVP